MLFYFKFSLQIYSQTLLLNSSCFYPHNPSQELLCLLQLLLLSSLPFCLIWLQPRQFSYFILKPLFSLDCVTTSELSWGVITPVIELSPSLIQDGIIWRDPWILSYIFFPMRSHSHVPRVRTQTCLYNPLQTVTVFSIELTQEPPTNKKLEKRKFPVLCAWMYVSAGKIDSQAGSVFLC